MVCFWVRSLQRLALFLHNQPRSVRTVQPRAIRPQLESLEAREVPSLTPLAANAGYPYTAIVELKATFSDHKTFVGTGVMVDRFHVLTAGHMVYSYQDGGF